ncbi:hypothetical protein ABZ924_07235, partial [Streptomyces sp. NPDC046876]|uniref:hypothetical protein n=1 Tax=Streptomyces sp. NPDC046876 TaxID=3155616 RepID=UPI0033C622E4
GYQLLALIFGTLLSSQGTDASFVLTRSNTYWGFPPGFRSSFFLSSIQTLSESFSLRPPGFRFRVFPFGGSNLTRLFSVPFPDRIRIRWPLEGLSLSGGADFIRFPEV